MVLSLIPVTALASEPTVIPIADSEDLVNAIKNQKSGQTWVFTQADTFDAKTPEVDGNNGGYDLPDGVEMPYPDGQIANHIGPYVFPIYVDNLALKKGEDVEGEVILTSSAVATATDNSIPGINGGGNWNWQSFMIISGSNVTIEGVTLKGNQNAFNVNGNNGGLVGKQCDKIIETVDGAGDLTLRNVVTAPQTVEGETGAYKAYNGTRRSGSLYFSHDYDPNKTVTLDNVYTYGGIKSANDVNINMSRVTINATDNTYAGYNADSANYAWNPGVRGGNVGDLDNVTVENGGLTIIVEDSIDSRQLFNESLLNGTTIQFTPGNYDITPSSTYSVSGQTGWYLPITSSVTLQGVDESGAVITDASMTQANLYSSAYTPNGGWASQNFITVFADDVTFEGLAIMNKTQPNKGIEVVGPVEGFTVQNCKFTPIPESLWPAAATAAGLPYADYVDYGSGIYFNGGNDAGKNITADITDNIFDRSGITFGSAAGGDYDLSGNTFNGVKRAGSGDDVTSYSSIGYTGKWTNPEGSSLGSAILEIEKNAFIDCGMINFSGVTDTTSPDLSGNYWGEDATIESISNMIKGTVTIGDYYTTPDMNESEKAEIGGTPVSNAAQLKNAIETAHDGDTIVMAPGTYDVSGIFTEEPAAHGFSLTKRLNIVGSGTDVTTIICNATTKQAVFTLKAGSEGSTFRNFTIKTSMVDTTQSGYGSIYFCGAGKVDGKETVIDHVNFVGPDSLENVSQELGINASSAGGPGNIKVTNCSFKNLKYGMFFDKASGLLIDNNVVDGTKYGGIVIGADRETKVSDNITISNNTLKNISFSPSFDDPSYSSGIAVGVYAGDADVNNNEIQMLNGRLPIYFSTIDASGNEVETSRILATFKDGDSVVAILSATPAAGETTVTVTAPAAPVKANYTFQGWKDGTNTYQAGDPVEITADTTLTAHWAYNGGGSGGGSSVTTYTVTVEKADNGTLSVSSKNASKGSTVTITVKPGEGYQPDTITVTDKDGKLVDLTKVNDTKYTFKMPAAKGIVGGYGNGKFGPEDSITREQMAVILYNYAKFKGEDMTATADLTAFSDGAQVSDWAEYAMKWAVGEKLINGSNNALNPLGTASRAEVAQVLMNYFGK